MLIGSSGAKIVAFQLPNPYVSMHLFILHALVCDTACIDLHVSDVHTSTVLMHVHELSYEENGRTYTWVLLTKRVHIHYHDGTRSPKT